MGAIQGSVNSILGTAAVAVGATKKLKTDQQANELHQQAIQQAEDKEALAIRHEAEDVNQNIDKLAEKVYESGTAEEELKNYKEGTYDTSGKIIRNRVTGRFTSKEEMNSDSTLLGLEEAYAKALRAQSELNNSVTRRKENLNLRINQYKQRTGHNVPEIDKIIGGNR